MIATMASIDDAAVDRVRAAHPGVFPTTGDLLKKWAPHLIALIYVLGSLWYFEVWRFLNVSELVWGLVRMFVPWNWEDMGDWQYGNIYNAIAQTMAMAMLGTFLGTLGAMVVGFLGARNVMSGFPFNIIRQVVRRFLDILRGIDQLVWGLVFVRAVGLGPLAGVLAIFVSDLGTLSKLYSEAIENIDRKQVEGIKSTGAGPLAVIRYGYIPQVLPVFISQSLYFWESNTRSATILGIVGAGGIGMILIERFRAGLYDQVVFVVLNVLLLIFFIDWLSKKIRFWAIGEKSQL